MLMTCVYALRSQKNYWGYNSVWQHILQPLFHYSGNTANLMYDDTLLFDTSIDEAEISSLFGEHGECEMLHKVMEEGLSLDHA